MTRGLIDGLVNKRQGRLPASMRDAQDEETEAERLIWKWGGVGEWVGGLRLWMDRRIPIKNS